MISLASIIEQFEKDFMKHYQQQILPSHVKALRAMKVCRNEHSPLMQLRCIDCEQQRFMPHSCGHRNCPHCQHYESQQWLERQCKKVLPASYFMLTFTLPAQLRPLAWRQQRLIYGMMFDCVWETLQTFCQNDKQLKGLAGVVTVLHTHARALHHHPHIHAVMPAAIVDKLKKQWRKKPGKYLFNHKALAKVFRAKMLERIKQQGLTVPAHCPQKWVVDCKAVGAGDKALIYLGRYLYRGVIREKDIISCRDGKVTYRYQDSKTKRYQTNTVAGAKFLWLIMQHVLPKGFRRARNYGFLHPNSKQLIQLLQTLLKLDVKKIIATIKPRPQFTCDCCGAVMQVIRTRIKRLPEFHQMASG
ncbi:MAG: IS91 family transposase [Gammaproteobacteria bacterium]